MAAPGNRPRAPRSTVGVLAVVAIGVVGVVARFVTRSPLWLDEALSANIAGLGLGSIPEALRHDGHPPLYYFLLHWWMNLFGEGDAEVRSLSGVLAVAALPLAWLVGRRVGGRRVAWATSLLLALSPFAVRYATETRMYALVILLVLAGHLLVRRAVEERDAPWYRANGYEVVDRNWRCSEGEVDVVAVRRRERLVV
ncbi:MAG: YraN family protein, partial [Actinomycetota bacterium]|nr:YraN family protein [Actinomycetota bacterium]